jgi:uncharacterized protein DUF4365
MKQTEAQSIGRKGERWFQNILPKEWIFQRPSEDIGIDGAVTIGTSDRISILEFGVQIKASRRWSSKHNIILLPNIGRDKVTYWAARLIPTMIVLYDEDKDRGYYAWVLDLIPNPKEFLLSRNATITLKIPKESRLDENAWATIHQRVQAYYEGLVDSLSRINATRAIFPILASLAMSLQLLHFFQFNNPPSESDEERLLSVSNVVAHKEVIISLNSFVAQLDANSQIAKLIRTMITAYRNEVDTFLAGFDAIVEDKKTVATWASSEGMRKSTPKLIMLITELLMVLGRISSST